MSGAISAFHSSPTRWGSATSAAAVAAPEAWHRTQTAPPAWT
eukprot:CAMPEP_0195081720 /NCGR_PEP_ID=MMETSP0448-20130528/23094_1 /TAXON_ID=66468 /ORGANISM="Heterocapsa triquestra, Strain CCMP 448" /LENGTH=41 /DNA_ID= /DNA_START= /DNA_END= /DNA_ORIENTATION=